MYEALIDDDRRENAFGLLMSLNMLIETPAGFDYTGADCCEWMREAGFRETRVEHLLGPDSMVSGSNRAGSQSESTEEPRREFFQASENSRFTHSIDIDLFCISRASRSPNNDRPFRGFNSRSLRNTVSASEGLPLRKSAPPSDVRMV